MKSQVTLDPSSPLPDPRHQLRGGLLPGGRVDDVDPVPPCRQPDAQVGVLGDVIGVPTTDLNQSRLGLPWFFGHLMWRGLVARECGGCWSVVEPGSATTSAGPHLTGLQGPRPGPESLLQLCRPLRGGGGRVGGDAGSRGACGAVHLRPGVRDRSRADLRGRTGRSVAGCGSDRFSSGPGCWGREPQGAGTVAELDTDSVGMPMVSMATALLDPLEVQGGGGL